MKMFKVLYGTAFDELWEEIFGENAELCIFCENETPASQSREELKRHFRNRHYRCAVFSMCQNNTVCTLPCRKNCLHRRSNAEKTRGHFHCSFCGLMYGRSQSFKKHMKKHSGLCNREGTTNDSTFKVTNNLKTGITPLVTTLKKNVIPPAILLKEYASTSSHGIQVEKQDCSEISKVDLSPPQFLESIYYCCVPLCNRNSKQHPHLEFQFLPRYKHKRLSLALQWRTWLHETFSLWNVNDSLLNSSTTICSAHFEKFLIVKNPASSSSPYTVESLTSTNLTSDSPPPIQVKAQQRKYQLPPFSGRVEAAVEPLKDDYELSKSPKADHLRDPSCTHQNMLVENSDKPLCDTTASRDSLNGERKKEMSSSSCTIPQVLNPCNSDKTGSKVVNTSKISCELQELTTVVQAYRSFSESSTGVPINLVTVANSNLSRSIKPTVVLSTAQPQKTSIASKPITPAKRKYCKISLKAV